uniref:Uncharacterized protein n=1 Tax=Picea glauca TaxID=3330 RepID=A0A124GP66_PICGL|nr:hypothetical protein ABT39_MTgene838 [Picea glauca]
MLSIYIIIDDIIHFSTIDTQRACTIAQYFTKLRDVYSRIIKQIANDLFVRARTCIEARVFVCGSQLSVWSDGICLVLRLGRFVQFKPSRVFRCWF